MNYYNYSVDLPYTKTKIGYRELNTQEQLLLAKANISFSNDKESIYGYNEFAFDVVLNCIKNKEDFKKINIIEYVMFLIKLRIVSIGSTIDFLLKTETESKTKTKIQIDLKKYIINLYEATKYFELEDNSILNDKNVEIKINWPNIKSIKTFNDLSVKNEYEIINDSLCEYIEYVKIKNDKLLFLELDHESKIKLFEKIPLSVKSKIQTKILESLKILSEYKLFGISFFDEYIFNFYNLSFIEHIKMFFSYDLKSLYQEIFFLSSYKLTPEYILSISHAERRIYSSIIEEQNKKQEKDSSSDIPDSQLEGNSAYSESIKNLALEFGDNLPK
jgi:hypothetical protein